MIERPRRLRRDGLRELVAETTLDAADLVAPVFVDATADGREAIESMPGHERVPVDEAVARVREVCSTGVETVLVFGVPASKDPSGSRADAADGVVQRATRRIAAETAATVVTDVCLCEYTSHGHCGVLADGARDADNDGPTVANDPTLDRLAATAVSHADAGADVVAPSSMTDGQVAAVRAALDDAGHEDVAVLSYAVKYESGFYGPFRDAADGAPAFGDRRHYQMDPANGREALREARIDAEEGADVLMVKPAMPYLDVLSRVRATVDRPVAAYQVSGEYAMLHAAADRGWLDLDDVAVESLLAARRAGADIVVTYFAERVASRL